MVAAGFLLGSALAQRIARRRGLDPVVFWNIMPWLVVGACVFGHLGDVAYRPELYLEHPLRLFAVWDGLASYSGFFGCAVIAVLYFRRAGVDPLKGCDVLVIGVTLGWAIGRIGCFLVHDHIGRPVAEVPAVVRGLLGWLAVQFPAGTAGRGAPAAARFELGLLDSLLAWALLAILLVLERTPRRPGMLVGTGAIFYGGVRFLLDFLRNVDLPGAEPRILGLTPGQYASIVAVALGAAVLRHGRERPPWPERLR
jgi:phosphatidylglycerol:prolipoprotein diacylglycerol transferase